MHTIVLEGRGPNTMSVAMLEGIVAKLDAAGDEPILLTGAGEAFSSGLDLDALSRADASQVGDLLDAMERATRRLFLHPAPVIAAVNGHAIAGGCLVVQCADWRITVDDPKVRFGMTGVALGLVYPPFVPAVFRARVPAPHVETVLMGAGRVDAREALRLGLVDEVVERDHLAARAQEVLTERARLPRAAYASIKRALREPAYAGVAEAHDAFREHTVPSWTHAIFGSRPTPVL
ncbi:MAG: enoyl-CoA hydratase/isomerase family protein [Sandaracinaceae bacterium]|nr:enoyl-CoA hydratase/isomerase family protein [Sandaracinaceae bacterium]